MVQRRNKMVNKHQKLKKHGNCRILILIQIRLAVVSAKFALFQMSYLFYGQYFNVIYFSIRSNPSSAMGCIFLAREIGTNLEFTLKFMAKERNCCAEDQNGVHHKIIGRCDNAEHKKRLDNCEPLIRREIEIHLPEHLTIVRIFQPPNNHWLVLEYAPGGDLYKQLKKQPNKRFDGKQTAGYIL